LTKISEADEKRVRFPSPPDIKQRKRSIENVKGKSGEAKRTNQNHANHNVTKERIEGKKKEYNRGTIGGTH